VKYPDRLRATYEFKPVDHLPRRGFGFWEQTVERWIGEGLPDPYDEDEHFGFDIPDRVDIRILGWEYPEFVPSIPEEILEASGDYEIVRDHAGRTVKFFTGRRGGFMPTYLAHAVTCPADWDERIAPLLSPDTPQRREAIDRVIAELTTPSAAEKFISCWCIGGYMYLRALVGPEGICYMFVDNPKLVHRMMEGWFQLADAVTGTLQQHADFDELFLGEDICYNHGLLISPGMVREFIFPYYRRLLDNVRSRQRGGGLHFHVDTDGYLGEAIDLYMEIGMDAMSPFEIAAGNDVLEIAAKYPNLVMAGGIDKRILAAGPGAIDEYLTRVIPPMVRRGGYIPTCDHGVPPNVSYASYMHYRKRIMELDHQ